MKWTVETASTEELERIGRYWGITPEFRAKVLAELDRRSSRALLTKCDVPAFEADDA